MTIINQLDLDAVQADPTLAHALSSFLRYATHRITDQSLPTFFDGLLPAQRKLLLSMQDLGALADRKHQKASRVVAQSTAAYHPVGNTYNVLVNMSQPYKVPIPLTDPEGNWGEPENGVAAAERYTEIRLSRFGQDVLFTDLPSERTPATRTPHDVVPTSLTYTDLHWEEQYLPARLPVLLLNGSNGIAVGIAQTFQPLRFDTVLAATRAVLNGTPLTDVPLHLGYPAQCAIVSTPDEVRDAFMSGRGAIKTAARYEWVESRGHTTALVITAVPPGTYYNTIGDAFADWKRNDVTCPFDSYRNETETSTRLVFELKRNARPTSPAHRADILRVAFKALPLTASMTVNMIALRGSFPVAYNLESFLTDWIAERSAIIQRVARAKAADLAKQLARLHLTVWLKRHLEFAIEQVKAAPTEADLAAAFNPRFVPDFGRDITADEVGLILNTNLRSISRLAEAELHARITKTEAEAARQTQLVESAEARADVIRDDLTYFEQHAKQYGITLPSNLYDAEIAALLTKPTKDANTNGGINTNGGAIIRAVPKYKHALEPYLIKAGELEVVAQSHAGVTTRLSNRSVRTTPLTVKLLDEADTLRTADFSAHNHLFMLAQSGKIYPILRDKLPIATPIYPGRLAQLLKLDANTFDGAVIVSVVSDNPTHLWIRFQDGTVKRTPLTDLPTLRSAIALTGPVTHAALIDKTPFTVALPNDTLTVDPTQYKESSRNRTAHLPKLKPLDQGQPVRVENKLIIVADKDTVAKRAL